MSFLDVLRYFRAERAALAVITALSVVGAMLDAASVVLVVGLADMVSRDADTFTRTVGPIRIDASAFTLTASAVSAILGSLVITLVVNWRRSQITTAFSQRRRLELLHEFLGASWSVQAKDRTGNLQVHLGRVSAATSLITHLSGAFRGLSGLAILVGTALLLSPIAAVGIVVLGLLLYTVLRPLNRLVKREGRKTVQLSKQMNVDFGELSDLSRDLRVFGVSERFEQRLADPIQTLGTAERRASVLNGVVTPVYQSIALVVIVSALALAANAGGVDIALLGAVALLVLRSVSYGQQFQNSLAGIHGLTSSLEALDATVADLAAAKEHHGSAVLDGVRTLSFADVSFSYGGDEPALSDVTLDLLHGEVVGIVGPSGAGKTTLGQLLMRLRAPDRGAITVNGEPIADYSDTSWARCVALVPQDPFLMHGTLAENIAFMRDELTRDDVIRAATAAGIHDTIMALDEGYDTPVGKSLRNLSGGQIQRIGIARALAGNPTMIVLDEPTSALDQQSEAIVQTTLEAMRGKALVVVIAHRLTTLSICDRVVVLEGGRVEADGTLNEVIGKSVFFKSAIDQLALATSGTLATADPVDGPA